MQKGTVATDQRSSVENGRIVPAPSMVLPEYGAGRKLGVLRRVYPALRKIEKESSGADFRLDRLFS